MLLKAYRPTAFHFTHERLQPGLTIDSSVTLDRVTRARNDQPVSSNRRTTEKEQQLLQLNRDGIAGMSIDQNPDSCRHMHHIRATLTFVHILLY